MNFMAYNQWDLVPNLYMYMYGIPNFKFKCVTKCDIAKFKFEAKKDFLVT